MILADWLAENRGRMISTARGWGCSLDRAEDAVQEASRRVLDSWAAYDGVSDLAPWFVRIMRNVFLDALKRADNRAGSLDVLVPWDDGYLLLADVIPSGEAPALEVLAAEEEGARVRMVLASLSTVSREALAAAEGRTWDQAARRLRVPLGTARSRISRAREAFRRAWGSA